MNKEELRIHYKEFLRKNQERINSASVKNIIIEQINSLLDKLKVQTIGLYYPLKYEINLLEIIPLFTTLRPEYKFFLPRIINNGIKYCAYNYQEQLQPNNFGILEPINNNFYKPELIIIPGLAFSKEGYRLGHGGGFFDRYINSNKNVLSIGVCLAEQLIDGSVNNLPITAHDEKVNFVVVG